MTRFEFFSVPIWGGEEETHALNRFLASHRIVEIDRQFLSDGANSAWSFCVGYSDAGQRPPSTRTGKVDYKEVLSDVEFARFARLRQLRKALAEREGVPAYAIFTNEQLAEMVQRGLSSTTALRDIPGVGEGRVEKYGAAFLDCLRDAGSKSRTEEQEKAP